jgi:acetyl esterase/lipase
VAADAIPRDNSFHPDLRNTARFLPRTLMTPRSLPVTRALQSLVFRDAKDVEALTLTSGGRVRLHRPPGDDGPMPAMLWIHAGGYVAGTPRQGDRACGLYSRTLGITVAAPSYRLAPEHPYPAALEDLYAALKWLLSLPSVDSQRVAIGGESAGGGLAAALAFMVRDRGEISPVLQLLSYPTLDDRTVSNPAVKRYYRLWNERSSRFGWASYLGGADPNVAVPARRADLAGLPAAWIGVGTLDLVYEEDVAYAERLRSASVPCDLEVVQGAFHAFDRAHARAPVSRAFFDSQCRALRAALKP